MNNNEEIELTSIQATAYWWVNLIRSKVKEILIEKSSNEDKTKFAKTIIRGFSFIFRKGGNGQNNRFDCPLW